MPKEYSFVKSDGGVINHRFELEREKGLIVVILKSGSSVKRADGTPHNNEYNIGFERLIQVLSEARVQIEKVVLDTRKTRKKGIPESDRILKSTYPIFPWDYQPKRLRLHLAGFAQRIGQEDGAKGGNNQKQLRVYIQDIHPGKSFNQLAKLLSGSSLPEIGVNILPPSLPSNGETLFTRSIDPEGWLYIIKNPMWPKWIKIGITRNLSSRLSSYNTGAPHIEVFFDYEFYTRHENAKNIESKLHTRLAESGLRGDSREWYKMPLEKGIEEINEQIRMWNYE